MSYNVNSSDERIIQIIHLINKILITFGSNNKKETLVNTNTEDNSITILSDHDIDIGLEEFGVDSITFIRIIVELEETFDIEISDEDMLFENMNTVRKINQTVNKMMVDISRNRNRNR